MTSWCVCLSRIYYVTHLLLLWWLKWILSYCCGLVMNWTETAFYLWYLDVCLYSLYLLFDKRKRLYTVCKTCKKFPFAFLTCLSRQLKKAISSLCRQLCVRSKGEVAVMQARLQPSLFGRGQHTRPDQASPLEMSEIIFEINSWLYPHIILDLWSFRSSQEKETLGKTVICINNSKHFCDWCNNKKMKKL